MLSCHMRVQFFIDKKSVYLFFLLTLASNNKQLLMSYVTKEKNRGKVPIVISTGETVEAFAPVIVSASRSTDIPAFYADWFFQRLTEGYSVWTNPFNGVPSYVSYKNTRFIVFWSKNPRPLLNHLDDLKEKGINCYIQYTLNDYEAEGLEKGVPHLTNRIQTFQLLVEKLGVGHVIWRFDPMILTNKITIDTLLEKVERIGNRLKGYTEKLVFSYADIASYKKVQTNLKRNGIAYEEWNQQTMEDFAERLTQMNKDLGWNYTIATCGEGIDLTKYGIKKNKCIDDDLMIRLAYNDKDLMDFLRVEIKRKGENLFDIELTDALHINKNYYAIKLKNNKDKGQRLFCGCIVSKDIGQYNTCPHLCEYCYANTSKESAVANYQQHRKNPNNPSII